MHWRTVLKKMIAAAMAALMFVAVASPSTASGPGNSNHCSPGLDQTRFEAAGSKDGFTVTADSSTSWSWSYDGDGTIVEAWVFGGPGSAMNVTGNNPILGKPHNIWGFLGVRYDISHVDFCVEQPEPPVDEPPVDEPPIDEPPVDEPPVDEPPVEPEPTPEPPVYVPEPHRAFEYEACVDGGTLRVTITNTHGSNTAVGTPSGSWLITLADGESYSFEGNAIKYGAYVYTFESDEPCEVAPEPEITPEPEVVPEPEGEGDFEPAPEPAHAGNWGGVESDTAMPWALAFSAILGLLVARKVTA